MWFVWYKVNGRFTCCKCEHTSKNYYTGRELPVEAKYPLTEEEFKLSLNQLKEKYPPPEV